MAYGRKATRKLRTIPWYQRVGSYGRKALGAAAGAAIGAGVGYAKYGLMGAIPGASYGWRPGWNYYKAIPASKKRWKHHVFRSNSGSRFKSNPQKWVGSNPGHRLGSNPDPIKGAKKVATFQGRSHRTHKKPRVSFFNR